MSNPNDVTFIARKSISDSNMSTGYAADANHYQRLSEQPIEIMQKLFTA